MSNFLKQIVRLQIHRVNLMFGAALVTSFVTLQSWAYPISTVVVYDTAPAPWDNPADGTTNKLVSADGLLTVQGWSDVEATVPSTLLTWWWVFGVNSGVGNGALIDGTEAMTLQYDKSVGCSYLGFIWTGDDTTPQPVSISGFLSDPGAFTGIWSSPRIHDLNYADGTVTFNYYPFDGGNDIGMLLFANPAASAGQTLKITYQGTSGGAALTFLHSDEVHSGPELQPENVQYNAKNVHTTPDGGLTVRGYSDQNAQTPANFGTWADQRFGIYGGARNDAIDGNECVTMQFANGLGLSRFEIENAQGQISISGLQSDPGFIDNAGGSFSQAYADGVLTFYPMDDGHHAYYFTNRAASAGRTLKVTTDPSSSDNRVGIASIGYVGSKTLCGPDIPSDVSSTYTTPDGLLTLNAFSDTPGTVPAYLHENVDWFGVAGGLNNEAIDGTESLNLGFSGAAGLSGLGMRYTWANITISGFASDPGFSEPSGLGGGYYVAETNTLICWMYSWRPPEVMFHFANPAASAGRTLSLHTSGDPGEQLVLTRVNYAAAPVTLSIEKVGNNVILTWPNGTLQQSTDVAGTYTDLTGVTSPYTNSISGTQKYFRVKQ